MNAIQDRATLPCASAVRVGLALLLWLIVPPLIGPRPTQAQDFNVRHFTADDGFPVADVRDLGQGENGVMWLAGGFGLVAYDGRTVTDSPLGPDLSWSGLSALRRDLDGGQWVAAGSAPFPVLRRVEDGFEALPLIATSDADESFVGLEVSGSADGEVALATSSGVYLWRGGEDWFHLTAVEGLPGRRIRALTRWRGRLVVGGDDGLAVIRRGVVDPGLGRRLGDDRSRRVLALAVDTLGADQLWVVADDWLGLQTEQDFQRMSGAVPWAGTPPAEGAVAAADGLGGVYVSIGREVFYFQADRGWEHLTAIHPLGIGDIRAIRVDREGSAWFGGRNGVAKIVNRSWLTYRSGTGLFASSITSLDRLRDGAIVVGHQGGLSWIRGSGIETRALPLTTGDGARLERVHGAAERRDGALWLALGELGLGILDGDELVLERDPALIGAEDVAIEPLSQEPWVVTAGQVLRRRPGGVWQKVEEVDGVVGEADAIEEDRFRALRADGYGMWVVHDKGLSLVTVGDGARHWWLETSSAEAVDATLSGADADTATVWLATAEGLFSAPFQEQELRPVSAVEGPLTAVRWCDQPLTPSADRDAAFLWLGTEQGLLRFLPGEQRFLEPLAQRSGLAAEAVVDRGLLQDRLGRWWIGTDRGLTAFDSRQAQRAAEPPRLELRLLTAADKEWELDGPIQLAPGVDQLHFRFRAVSLLEDDPLRFRTRLVGRDTQFSSPFASPGQEVTFFDLEAGTYRLQIQVRGVSGEWSEVVESPPIFITGPFWQQTWFFAVLGLGALVALFTLQGFFSQRRHSLLLEEEVARRVAELSASEDRYRKTFRTIEDGVVTTDEHGRVALLNPRAQELTGWSEPDAVGTSIDDVLRLFQQGAGEQKGAELSLLSGDLQDTIGPTQTAFLESRVGNRRLVELSASPIVSRGAGFAGMVFTFRDISRKREMEAELARAHKLEAIGLLAGGIAHDFNNLLTVILGNLSLLQDTLDLDEMYTGVLHDAENALMRARDLTQQLLTFSRGGAPVREAASISEVIQDSASFVLSGSKTRCDVDLQEDLHVVEIDAGQISQVLNNLLINASQAMPDGGQVRIVGRNVMDPPHPLKEGAYVAIDVSDTGIGIAEHLIHRIFDPYFSTKQEGRGLGLASAYSIVKSHDGLLTVQSALGEGTTFRILLPASDKDLVRQAEIPTEGVMRWEGRILVMDDDPVVRRTTSVMLERLGFGVVSAVDGHQALNLYARNMEAETPFVAVMMDLTVPGGMGGQEAIQHILQLDPDVKGIVYSGYSNDPVLANHQHYGFRGRLSKPFRLRDLQDVLSQVLADPPSASRPDSAAGAESGEDSQN